MSMTTRQTPDAVREAVARIVDADAFDPAVEADATYPVAMRRLQLRRKEALDKTDAILAALDSRAGDAGEVMSPRLLAAERAVGMELESLYAGSVLHGADGRGRGFAKGHAYAWRRMTDPLNRLRAAVAELSAAAIGPSTPAPAVDADGVWRRHYKAMEEAAGRLKSAIRPQLDAMTFADHVEVRKAFNDIAVISGRALDTMQGLSRPAVDAPSECPECGDTSPLEECATCGAYPTRKDAPPAPAPAVDAVPAGEVERPLNRGDLYRFMDALKLSEKRDVAKAIGFDLAPLLGENDMDRWKRMWAWAADNGKQPELATAIRASLSHGEGRK